MAGDYAACVQAAGEMFDWHVVVLWHPPAAPLAPSEASAAPVVAFRCSTACCWPHPKAHASALTSAPAWHTEGMHAVQARRKKQQQGHTPLLCYDSQCMSTWTADGKALEKLSL